MSLFIPIQQTLMQHFKKNHRIYLSLTNMMKLLLVAIKDFCILKMKELNVHCNWKYPRLRTFDQPTYISSILSYYSVILQQPASGNMLTAYEQLSQVSTNEVDGCSIATNRILLYFFQHLLY